jgi:hypothetical protein
MSVRRRILGCRQAHARRTLTFATYFLACFRRKKERICSKIRVGPKGFILTRSYPQSFEPLTHGFLALTSPFVRSGARCDARLRYDPTVVAPCF